MKKILGFLGAIGLVTTSGMTVVACTDPANLEVNPEKDPEKLQEQLKKLEENKGQLEKLVNDLETELNSVVDQLLEKTNDLAELIMATEDQDEEVAKLIRIAGEVRNELSQEKAEHETDLQFLAEYIEKVKALVQSDDNQTKELEEALTELIDTKEILEQKKSKIRELRTEIAVKDKTIEDLNTKIVELEEKLSFNEGLVDRLQDQLNKMSDKLDQANEQLKKLEEKNKGLEADLEAAKETNANNQQQIKEHEKIIADLEAKKILDQNEITGLKKFIDNSENATNWTTINKFFKNVKTIANGDGKSKTEDIRTLVDNLLAKFNIWHNKEY